MAYNEISLPQWQNLVRRVFGMTGPGGNLPTVAPELQGVVILQPSLSEYRRLRGEKLWSSSRRNDSGVGTVGTVGFVNPAGSGAIVVVERAYIACISGTATTFCPLMMDTQANVEGSTPGVAGVITQSTRDSREITPGAGQSAAIQRFGPVAVPANGFQLTAAFANAIALSPPSYAPAVEEIVLFPGFGLLASANQSGAGNAVILQLQWYERILEQAEFA